MFCVTMCNFDLQGPGFSRRAARVCDGEIGSPLDHGMVSCCLDGCNLDFHSTLSADAVFLIYSQMMHVNMCGLHVLDGYRQDVSPKMEMMQMYW